MSRRLPWIVSFLGLGLAACAVSPTGQPQLSLVSPAQEVEMGRQLSREIEQKVRLVQDPVIAGYVERVGQRLAAVSDWREIRYHFKVVDTKEINAFALPAGTSTSTRGCSRRPPTRRSWPRSSGTRSATSRPITPPRSSRSPSAPS